MCKLSCFSNTPSCIFSQFLWYNKYITINNKPIHLKSFSNKDINFVCQLFHDFGIAKSWEELKFDYNLSGNLFFQWIQIMHCLPITWKSVIKDNQFGWNSKILDHHLIKNNTLFIIEKLNSKILYSILISKLYQ